MKNFKIDTRWVNGVLAFIFALFVWIFVIASENPTVYEDVDGLNVNYVGWQDLERQGLLVSSDRQATVDLRVTGPLDRMYQFNESAVAITVDLTSILSPGVYDLPYRVDLGVAGVEATKKTEHITVNVEREQVVTMPVELNIIQQPDLGYVCSAMSLDQDAVMLRGPESVVGKVQEVVVDFSFAGVRSSGSRTVEYLLLDEDGAQVVSSDIDADVPALRLSYTMQQKKEIPLNLFVNPTDLVGSDRIVTTISPAMLTVQGPPESVALVNSVDLGQLNLADLLAEGRLTGGTITAELPVIIPNGVICEDAPEQAQISIRLRDLVQQTITLPSEFFDQELGMRYLTESLDVHLLGTAQELSALAPAQIRITPLMVPSEMDPGSHSIPVEVTLGSRRITVLGTYLVNVYVEEHTGS